MPKTMASVFAQRYKPIEIVVIDDGSTDNTRELMASYGGRVRYYWQENQGIAVTRTNACLLAMGEFIAFQDDDDLMPPDRIVHLLEAIHRYPSAVLAFGDYAFLDPVGNLTGKKSCFRICIDNKEPINKPLLIEDGYAAILWPAVTPLPHTTLFRRADAKRIGWFDTRFFHACEDTDFFARLGQLGPIVYVPEVVSYYRCGHSSLCKKRGIASYNRLLLFEKHLGALKAEQRDLKKRLQFRLRQILKQIARYQSQGDIADSLPADYLSRGLSILRLKDRIGYRWYILIRLPLRRLIGRIPKKWVLFDLLP